MASDSDVHFPLPFPSELPRRSFQNRRGAGSSASGEGLKCCRALSASKSLTSQRDVGALRRLFSRMLQSLESSTSRLGPPASFCALQCPPARASGSRGATPRPHGVLVSLWSLRLFCSLGCFSFEAILNALPRLASAPGLSLPAEGTRGHPQACSEVVWPDRPPLSPVCGRALALC